AMGVGGLETPRRDVAEPHDRQARSLAALRTWMLAAWHWVADVVVEPLDAAVVEASQLVVPLERQPATGGCPPPTCLAPPLVPLLRVPQHINVDGDGPRETARVTMSARPSRQRRAWPPRLQAPRGSHRTRAPALPRSRTTGRIRSP